MTQPGESRKERLDRELGELLQELRVVIPGVQILLAFLLAVPFAQRFVEVTPTQKNAYFIAFLSAAASTVLLMSPTVFHRIQWRARDKEMMLHVSNVLSLVGAFLLSIAVTAVVFLISDFVFGRIAAIATASVVAVLMMGFWFALPVYRRITTSRAERKDQ